EPCTALVKGSHSAWLCATSRQSALDLSKLGRRKVPGAVAALSLKRCVDNTSTRSKPNGRSPERHFSTSSVSFTKSPAPAPALAASAGGAAQPATARVLSCTTGTETATS